MGKITGGCGLRGGLLGATIIVFAMSAGAPAMATPALVSPAQALPGTVEQVLTLYRSGGVRLSDKVSGLVLEDLDYIEAFCHAARLARPAQRAGVVAGFVQSVAVLFQSDSERAREAGQRIRDCCDLVVLGDPDIRIQTGVELALSARATRERNAASAEQLNDLVRFCRDEIVETAYLAALGSDRIGLLLGSDVEATQNLGDIQEVLSGGGYGAAGSDN